MLGTLGLKIIAAIEIMIASFSGSCLPFVYIYLNQVELKSLDQEPLFFILKSISCGVIIGVALLHLLPDGDESLSTHYSYPVSYLMAGVGIIISLTLEQFSMWLVSTTSASLKQRNTIDNSQNLENPLHEDPTIPSRIKSNERASDFINAKHSLGSSTAEMVAASRAQSVCEADMLVQIFADSNDIKTLIKAYILECAIAVHSIIMGISLGAMNSNEKGSIKVLMIAYSIHQFLEGISLGCALSSAQLSPFKLSSLITFFVCTLPIGIFIGIGISSGDSLTTTVIEGVFNSIAAGILIYVSMVEMMAEEFGNVVVRNNYLLKVGMILAIFFGIAGMAILAIWA